MPSKKGFNLNKALEEIEKINEWFQKEDINLDEALEKLKKGSELLKKAQSEVKEIENEFITIKENLDITNGETPKLDIQDFEEETD